MSLISWFCFGACILIILTSLRRSADVFSPARVFMFVWALVIGLTELKLSRLQAVWSTEVWLQVLVGPLAFLLGLYAAYVLNLRTSLLPLNSIRDTWRDVEVNPRKLFIIVTILFLLFFVAFAVIVVIKGVKPPLFSARPGLARLEFTLFGIGLFLHNVAPLVFLSALFMVVVRGHRAQKWLLAAMSIVSVLMYFTLLQRFQLVMAAAVSLVFVYYTTRHLRWSTILPYGLGAVGLFYWISTLRSGIKLYVLYLFRESKMTIPPRFAWVTEPYMYFAMNVENLARGIEKLDHHTFGYYTFNFVFSLSGLKHLVDEYFGIDDFPYLISGYNTYTSFWVYYRDFGILGTAIFPLVMGFAIGMVYAMMRNRPGLHIIAIYSGCVFLIAFSFFNNPLTLLWFVYSLAVTLVGFRLMRTSTMDRLPAVEGA